MTVDFIRHTWQDWPSTETPITADELNRLEEGIAGLYSDLDGIDLANIEQTVDDLEEAVENFKAGVEITQEEYDNLTPEEKNNGTVYYITDAPSTPAISALDASYNNSTSGLTATNVQSAIDEVQGEIDELNSNITNVPVIYRLTGGASETIQLDGSTPKSYFVAVGDATYNTMCIIVMYAAQWRIYGTNHHVSISGNKMTVSASRGMIIF